MRNKTEASFWRFVAGALGLSLVVCVLINTARNDAVPHQITLFLFGCLVALGVGSTIVNPNTSQAMLSEHEEFKFRRKQYAVGFFFSAILALLLFLTELRHSVLSWLFAPIIALPFGLLIRNRITKKG